MRNVVLGFCLLMNCAIVFAQKAATQPQTLITEKHTITATAKLPNNETVTLRGEAVYHVREIKRDDTFLGKFVFVLTDDARNVLAKKTNQPLTKLPATIENENVVADFGKNAKCPTFHLEFNKLALVTASGLPLAFERFRLDLKETPQEVSTLVCRYAVQLWNGRSHPARAIGPRINRLLKGEATEN